LKSGSLNLLETSGRVQACNGIALPLSLTFLISQNADRLIYIYIYIYIYVCVCVCVCARARARARAYFFQYFPQIIREKVTKIYRNIISVLGLYNQFHARMSCLLILALVVMYNYTLSKPKDNK
jgi:hypothetical protein